MLRNHFYHLVLPSISSSKVIFWLNFVNIRHFKVSADEVIISRWWLHLLAKLWLSDFVFPNVGDFKLFLPINFNLKFLIDIIQVVWMPRFQQILLFVLSYSMHLYYNIELAKSHGSFASLHLEECIVETPIVIPIMAISPRQRATGLCTGWLTTYALTRSVHGQK